MAKTRTGAGGNGPGPSPIPHGRTARRLEWAHLPPRVRDLVERRIGAPVLEAASQGSGFTPGFASVLTCADGSRHFVKGASVKAQRMFAESYREEARKLAALPASVSAPALVWVHDDEDWVLLETSFIEGRAPRRPWRQRDLDAALATLAECARELTPVPPGLELATIASEFAQWPDLWEELGADDHGLEGFAEHVEEAAALARGFAEASSGETVVHTDVRDDNLIIDGSGRAWLCDWNWPVVGAAWLDTVFLLIGPRGDGLDVETVLTTSPLTAQVPPAHVDAALALVTGYFLRQAQEPVPPTSPHMRAAQRWQGEVCWDWLAERRGW